MAVSADSEVTSIETTLLSRPTTPIERPCLYIVATPIGNMGDVTARALHVLREVNHLACEDTRVTRQLLSRFGISQSLSSYHDHNGDTARPKLLSLLAEGKAVALVSDAGTPLISDPGYKLVAEARDKGFKVVPIPGASALTAAISAAGLPSNRVSFFGFPPQKAKGRRDFYASFKTRPETLVFYESTRRLVASLRDARSVYGDRKGCVARELTKRFEEVVTDNIKALIAHFEEKGEVKGECVLLIEGRVEDSDIVDQAIDKEKSLRLISRYLKDKDAASLASDLFGGSKKDYYQQLIALKGAQEDN